MEQGATCGTRTNNGLNLILLPQETRQTTTDTRAFSLPADSAKPMPMSRRRVSRCKRKQWSLKQETV